jgi:hypothetical protein
METVHEYGRTKIDRREMVVPLHDHSFILEMAPIAWQTSDQGLIKHGQGMGGSLNKDGVFGSTSYHDHVAVLCPRDMQLFVIEMKLPSLKRAI